MHDSVVVVCVGDLISNHFCTAFGKKHVQEIKPITNGETVVAAR